MAELNLELSMPIADEIGRAGARGAGVLTPMHRLRQLEPSWFRRGHTTSLFESVIEKDEVREVLGGILNSS